MTEAIRVRVVEYADRNSYLLQYTCPETGRKVTQTAKAERTGRKRDRLAAEREAQELEKELNNGPYRPRGRRSWEDFRDEYEATIKKPKTLAAAMTALNRVEKILRPTSVGYVTAARLKTLEKILLAGSDHAEPRPRSVATVASYMRTILAAMRWAAKEGYCREPDAADLETLSFQPTMKGRAITLEEFERMLCKVATVVLVKRHNPRPPKTPTAPDPAKVERERLIVERWKFFLEGLWLSGFRLAESLQLSWDDPSKLLIDLTGRRPKVRIPSHLEKGGRKDRKERRLPLTPDFVEHLLKTPQGERHGPVFKLLDRDGKETGLSAEWVGRVVSKIGEKAGVIVATTDAGNKFASAHDFRRAFGTRWAPKVMPSVLKEMMRHARIETTMEFYVDQDADTLGDVIWQAGNNSVNNALSATSGNEEGLPQLSS